MDYKLLEVVGRGKFGTVHKAQASNGSIVAVKILNLDTDSEEIKDIQGEVQLLSHLRGAPNIPQYHGSTIKGHKLWVVMDFCAGGSIRTLLRPGPLDEKYIGVIARELFIALQFIHSNKVIHRDIKAANILISKEGHVRLCDFGVAAQLTSTALKRTTMAGTPYWMAPEVITEGATYNYKADIWSAGITIYEMATGNPPYSDKDAMRAMQLLTQHEPPRLEGRQYSTSLKEIIALCLEENPQVRPSAESVLKSKFIKIYKPVSSGLLKEVIGRYLLWRDNNSKGKYDEDTASHEVYNIEEGEAYDVKWDFDSLKSAEYIMNNEIEINDYMEPSSSKVSRSPSVNDFSKTYTMGNTMTGTLQMQSQGQINTQTCTKTLDTSTNNPLNQTSRKDVPKSLLSIFENELSSPSSTEQFPLSIEESILEEVEMNNENSKSYSPDYLISPPIMPTSEQGHVPLTKNQQSISIEIPNMDNIENQITEKERQRSKSGTIPIDPLPVRRPTINIAKKTPSPSRLMTSNNEALESSPLKSPMHMKPLQPSLSQPLLQPLNQKVTPPSTSQTMSSFNTDMVSPPDISQLNIQMPTPSSNRKESTIIPPSSLKRPVLHLNLSGSNSPVGFEKNQFGVDTNAAGLPLAMTPVTEAPVNNLITPEAVDVSDHDDIRVVNEHDLITSGGDISSTSTTPLHMNVAPPVRNMDFEFPSNNTISYSEKVSNEHNDTLTDNTFNETFEPVDQLSVNNEETPLNSIFSYPGLSSSDLGLDLSDDMLPSVQDRLIELIHESKTSMHSIMDADFDSELGDDISSVYLTEIASVLGKISQVLEITAKELDS